MWAGGGQVWGEYQQTVFGVSALWAVWASLLALASLRTLAANRPVAKVPAKDTRVSMRLSVGLSLSFSVKNGWSVRCHRLHARTRCIETRIGIVTAMAGAGGSGPEGWQCGCLAGRSNPTCCFSTFALKYPWLTQNMSLPGNYGYRRCRRVFNNRGRLCDLLQSSVCGDQVLTFWMVLTGCGVGVGSRDMLGTG
eukprot:1368004-Rhodomonas_salina.2